MLATGGISGFPVGAPSHDLNHFPLKHTTELRKVKDESLL